MLSVRPLFTLALPPLWLITCLLSFRHPGDEYGLFGVGSLAGLWIHWLIGNAGSPLEALISIAVTGTLTMLALGYLLDRLRGPLLPWLAIWLVAAAGFTTWTLWEFPSWERAIGKNGSLAAYVLFGMTLGLLLATLVMIAATAPARLLRRVRCGRAAA